MLSNVCLLECVCLQASYLFWKLLTLNYDVAYAQFLQDPLDSLKMALIQRRNMLEQDEYFECKFYCECISLVLFRRNVSSYFKMCADS
jgi:hypothetical protein